MAAQRKKPREAVTAPGRSAESRFTILLEEIRQQNSATLDAVQSLEIKLTRKIDDLRAELLPRIEALEFAVRKNSEDIRKNSEDIAQLRREIAELREDVRGKVDRTELSQLKERVSRLEERLGMSAAPA